MSATARLLLVLLLLVQGGTYQEPPEKDPDVVCSPRGNIVNRTQTADHPCHCERMNRSSSCDDPKMDSHDPQCNKWCYEKHCACPVKCAADLK